jgi:3',5'-cyclic AMP phosphodiesterase CpdA
VRTILHLSDLHMGRLDPHVLSPLTETIRSANADLVVISGDFTQRATDAQFRSARAFLDAIDQRTLCIPGNHDVPLWNVAARFLTPLDRYRRYISPELSPEYRDEEMIVIGVNTARSFAWGEGRISLEEVERVLTRLASAAPNATRIVVTHHPFDLPPGVHEKRLVGRARAAMARLAGGGADLFLSGHLHLTHISQSAERYRIAGHSALIVQAGTVSMRGRGEEPSFNVLRLERPRLVVGRFLWNPANRRFEETAFGTYRRDGNGWTAVEDVSASTSASPES